MGDVLITIPDNPLCLKSFEAMVDWTVSYLLLKHSLEVIAFTPEIAISYLSSFSDFSTRCATEMKKQYILEARLPREMRESVEAENSQHV